MSDDDNRALVVLAADERFGLWARDVQTILRAARLTRLPDVPSSVEGLLNYHGTALPVVDLRARFSLPTRAMLSTDVLVVVSAARRTWALRADSAQSLLSLAPGAVVARAQVTARAPLVRGVACLPDGLLFLADPDDFFDAAEHAAIASALGRAEPPGAAP